MGILLPHMFLFLHQPHEEGLRIVKQLHDEVITHTSNKYKQPTRRKKNTRNNHCTVTAAAARYDCTTTDD